MFCLSRVAAGHLSLVSAVALAAVGSTTPSAALTITPLYDSSVTSSGVYAAYQGAVETVIARIEGLYSDPGNVAIVFKYGAGGFLGQSRTAKSPVTYSSYVGALAYDAAVHPQNSVLATAVANLSSGNDASGAKQISATESLLRVALGGTGFTPCFNAAGNFVSGCGQAYDGVITLSSSFGFSFTEPFSAPPDKYDAVATFEHEINEILGGGGQGSSVGSIDAYGPLDLYRYSANGTPSFATSASAYFSIDGGATNIINFSRAPDYGDWAPLGYVQSAQADTNTQPSYTTASPEYVMMLSLGWDPVPEPGTLALFASGLFGLGLLRRGRR